MKAHTCNPSTRKPRQKDHCELEARQGYRAKSCLKQDKKKKARKPTRDTPVLVPLAPGGGVSIWYHLTISQGEWLAGRGPHVQPSLLALPLSDVFFPRCAQVSTRCQPRDPNHSRAEDGLSKDRVPKALVRQDNCSSHGFSSPDSLGGDSNVPLHDDANM